ncbi:uncharacterized protein PFL1_05833 [Pseudozyma flocculosa PF-1]|uniref:Cyclase n=2 Tax=Pseudozyma flocculosa TaxID=84751 RepID=A0A5C3F314_9BASI|nr:uncharacterized protein PFL1_05833 [Pseudozyma flocculosa PF-1]EPQ26511.1 hypothetical protein PFL1_05833 [Pseudozyma flocculosa PF-1]SPO38500.1 uncharacterized protein PSFLO_03978 [Pseudozyma flocculosa]
MAPPSPAPPPATAAAPSSSSSSSSPGWSTGGKVDWRTVPDLDDLPPVEGQPAGCAWNFWGRDDRLGTLNLLTPQVVAAAAASEVRTGERVQIDWGLDSVDVPLIDRKPFHHRLVDLHASLGVYATDDELHLNTQTSSQFDGFAHFAWNDDRQGTNGVYYQGLRHQDLHSADDAASRNHLGIHHWCMAGGIAGRGVLVDWVRWWEETRSDPLPAGNTSYPIPLSQIEAVLAHQRTELRPGDILLLRTGVVRWCESASMRQKQEAFTGDDNFPGFEPTEESKRWLWNHKFAAVAADNPSFEHGPHGDLWLHNWLLPMWGCPIGELFDLERLSQTCKAHDRWSFFITSAPYRVTGGIASSPNSICIF